MEHNEIVYTISHVSVCVGLGCSHHGKIAFEAVSAPSTSACSDARSRD